MERPAMYFYDEEGERLGSDDLQPIPLFKGMQVTIHSLEGTVFEVVDWNYHHGHPDEDWGLRIFLKKLTG